MARAQALSTGDAIWLHMEHPTNLMYVTGIMVFEETPDIDKLKAILNKDLLKFERFRSVLRPKPRSLSKWAWEVDENFDIDQHVFEADLPGSGSHEDLQNYTSGLLGEPLDMNKAVWDIRLLPNYEEGCAMLIRIHHAIADGIALISVLLSVMDDDPLEASTTPPKKSGKSKPSLVKRITKLPSGVKMAGKFATTTVRMLTVKADPPTRLRGQLNGTKRVVWSKGVPLATVKAIGKQAGGTINDVLVTILSGALRRYLLEHGEAANEEIRLIIPANIRPIEKAFNLGNGIGSVLLKMPINIEDPKQRLAILKERMDSIKSSPEAVIAYFTGMTLGALPPKFASDFVENNYKSGSAIMTNVPGPRQPIFLAGKEVKSFMFWGPLGGRLAVGVNILSYNGEVTLGIYSDTNVVPDPENILSAFLAEYEAMAATVN